jgi:hypothetical protein
MNAAIWTVFFIFYFFYLIIFFHFSIFRVGLLGTYQYIPNLRLPLRAGEEADASAPPVHGLSGLEPAGDF